jgi:hypothetical protein
MPDSSDKFLLLLDKIQEIGERTVRMEVEQRLMKEDLEEVKVQDKIQNELLADHIAGVKTAQARLDVEVEHRKDLTNRVEALEVPRKFIKNIYHLLMYAGAVVGIVYEAGRILHKW